MGRDLKVGTVEKIWLSSREAKKYLDCSDNFLKELRDQDLIRFSKVRNKYFYPLAYLQRLLEQNLV